MAKQEKRERRREREKANFTKKKRQLAGALTMSVSRSDISRENFHKKETATGERKKFQAKEFRGFFLRRGMLLKKDIRR